MKGIDGHKCTMSLSVVRATVGISAVAPPSTATAVFAQFA